jgi:hypothetical protein
MWEYRVAYVSANSSTCEGREILSDFLNGLGHKNEDDGGCAWELVHVERDRGAQSDFFILFLKRPRN